MRDRWQGRFNTSKLSITVGDLELDYSLIALLHVGEGRREMRTLVRAPGGIASWHFPAHREIMTAVLPINNVTSSVIFSLQLANTE